VHSVIRILYLITDLEIGGTERALERLVLALDRRQFEPVVVTLKGDGPIGRTLASRGIDVVNLKLRSELNLGVVPRLYALLRARRPQVLHTFLFHANVIGRVVGRLARVPRVLSSIRTMEGRFYHFPLERLSWLFARDRVVCVSKATADFVRRRAGIAVAHVAYNGVPEPVTAQPGVQTELRLRGKEMIATAARLAEGKGVKTLLRAAPLIAARRPAAAFVIIGGGELEGALMTLAKELGVADRVHFVGWRDDVSRAVKGASVFVHASRLGEGMPNAVLEAMMAGLPVVATDVGGTREAVVEGETGYLVPVRDPAAVADRVVRLLSDPERARAMGAMGLARAREIFSVEAMVARYEQLYRA